MYHQESLIAKIEKMPSLSETQKSELTDLCLRNQSPRVESYQAIRGLLALQAGDFQNMALFKKTRFLETLQTFLEGGLGQDNVDVYKAVRILSDSGHSGSDSSSACVEIRRFLGPKIAQIVRSDRFSQVRTDAVLALIRLGDPASLGTRLGDYLPGLLSRNSFSACSVLHFIFHTFGPRSLGPVIGYLLEKERAFPSLLIGLLEGFCEENRSLKDQRTDLDRLRSRCNQMGGRGLSLREPLGPAFKDSLRWSEHAKAFNSYLRRWDPNTPLLDFSQEASRKNRKKNTSRRVSGFNELRYRFTRIRSSAVNRGTREDQPCHTSQR
jgi:hypothetical protein